MGEFGEDVWTGCCCGGKLGLRTGRKRRVDAVRGIDREYARGCWSSGCSNYGWLWRCDA